MESLTADKAAGPIRPSAIQVNDVETEYHVEEKKTIDDIKL